MGEGEGGMAIGVTTFQTAGKKLVKRKTAQELMRGNAGRKGMQIGREKLVERVRKTLT